MDPENQELSLAVNTRRLPQKPNKISTTTLLLLDKKKEVSEILAKSPLNYDEIKQKPILFKFVHIEQVHAYITHKRLADKLLGRVKSDPISIIMDFLGTEGLEKNAITAATLNKLYLPGRTYTP